MSDGMMSVLSVKELSRNVTSNSTLSKSGSTILVNVEDAYSMLNLIKSRMAFVKGNFKKGDETRRGRPNHTQTYVNNDFKVKLDDLWAVINNVHITSTSLQVMLYHSLAFELLSRYERNCHQLSISCIEDMPQKIVCAAVSLADLSEKQGQIIEERDKDVQRYFQSQIEVVQLSGNIGLKINHNEVSQVREAELHRIKQRLAKTKCARAVINCLLSFNGIISYEHQKDLLDLKMKYRCPPNLNE